MHFFFCIWKDKTVFPSSGNVSDASLTAYDALLKGPLEVTLLPAPSLSQAFYSSYSVPGTAM